jgi:hypothetical protein
MRYRDGIKMQVVMPWKFRSRSLIAASEQMRTCQDPSQRMAVETDFSFHLSQRITRADYSRTFEVS